MTSRDNLKTTLTATITFFIGLTAARALLPSTNFRRSESSGALWDRKKRSDSGEKIRSDDSTVSTSDNDTLDGANFSVLPCIRNRRSIFPKSYLKDPPPVDDAIIRSLLDAALWGPFHGKNHAGSQHPARFVVLGKKAMVAMQEMTLKYYDENWKEVGWGSGKVGTQEEYDAWRTMTHGEITGRWDPCSHMIAIVMRRHAGKKRMPEWEEAAATAAAVQNMHIQSTKFPQLACYWSSWHEAARASDEMKEFLKMEPEDKCLGIFCVAQKDPKRVSDKDRRKRDRSLMQVEWRE